MRLDLNKWHCCPGGHTWMLFERIGGGCIMMGHLVSLLFRFMGSEACYNHYGDCKRKRELGLDYMGIGGGDGNYTEVFFFSGNTALLNHKSLILSSLFVQWHFITEDSL